MTKLGMNFDRLIGLRPSNKEAAMSTNGGKGQPLETKAFNDGLGRDLPFPLKPITPDVRANRGFVDLTGQVNGRLTFLGLSRDHKSPARWVARCACGKYVLRRFRGAMDPATDRCADCEHTKKLRESTAKPGATR